MSLVKLTTSALALPPVSSNCRLLRRDQVQVAGSPVLPMASIVCRISLWAKTSHFPTPVVESGGSSRVSSVL